MFQLLSKLYFLQNLLGKLVSLWPPVLTHNLGKYLALKKAFYLTSLENLQGDYLEFGTFTGSSFACALQCAKRPGLKEAHTEMKFFGFDSFEGFGELDEGDKHPFYTDINFKTDYKSVQKRLQNVAGKRKNNIKLIKGFFDKTCKGVDPKSYGIDQAAIILIDNDTFSAALDCLNFCTPLIQEGTILIIDDAFSYKGSLTKGVHGAMQTWLEKNNTIRLRKVSDYGMGGEMFIVAQCV